MFTKIKISEPKYVGSTSLVDGRAFTGVRKFISINNVTFWDTGEYACASENIAGSDITTFKITVLRKIFIFTKFYLTRPSSLVTNFQN